MTDHTLPSKAAAPLLPVITLDDPDVGVTLGHILVDSGITHVEVALRTPTSMQVLEAMAVVSGLTVGAGTVLTESQMRECHSAGAAFAVSPGLDPTLVQTARDIGLSYIPGVATASELQHARRLGQSHVKFFPAAMSGGPAAIKALSAPFPDMMFLPSGGIRAGDVNEYLAVPAVFAVSGAWMIPGDALRSQNWQAVRASVRAATTAVSG
ncbi:bifunctional 4-hydroxy-2-oxoglutarate aldolase/2-dehydro-3-deoxy-phosphogluconate aldolase [Microbacterium sp. NPDC003461]